MAGRLKHQTYFGIDGFAGANDQVVGWGILVRNANQQVSSVVVAFMAP